MKALTPDGRLLVEKKIGELQGIINELKKIREYESLPSKVMQEYIVGLGALQALHYIQNITDAHENTPIPYPFVYIKPSELEG